MIPPHFLVDWSSRRMTDQQMEYSLKLLKKNPDVSKLQSLHIYDNRITKIPHVTHLQCLWLGHNRIRDDEVILASSQSWPFLVDLFLDDNFITDLGATRIAETDAFPRLRRLGLHTNCLSPVGVRGMQRLPLHTVWVGNQRGQSSRTNA